MVRDVASLTAGVLSLHRGLMLSQQGFRGMAELETRLVAIRQITNGTVTQTQALGRAAIDLAKDLGVSQSALLGTSQELL